MPHWYYVAAAVLTGLVQLLKILPVVGPIWNAPRFKGARFLVPLIIGAATAAIGALAQGLSVWQVLLAALQGIPVIGAVASGYAGWLRESPLPWSGGSGGAKAAATVAALVLLTGCTPQQAKTIDTALSDFAIATADASNVLDAIETLANIAFPAAPNPAEQAKVDAGLQTLRSDLSEAARTAQAAKSGTLTQAQVESAFQKFREDYAALGDLLGKDGIADMGPDGAIVPKRQPGKFGAAQSEAAPAKIAAPLALSLKVHQ